MKSNLKLITIRILQAVPKISIFGIFVSLLFGIIDWLKNPIKTDIYAILILVFCVIGSVASECLEKQKDNKEQPQT